MLSPCRLVRLEPDKAEHPYTVIAHLPARVLGVYGDDARLLLFAARSGVFDLTNPSDPRWLGCAP